MPLDTSWINVAFSFCRVIKRRVMLLLGLVLSSLASLGFALSVYIPTRHRFLFSALCLLLRVVNGVGAAAVDTSSMAICSESVSVSVCSVHIGDCIADKHAVCLYLSAVLLLGALAL